MSALAAFTKPLQYVCKRSESVFTAIEKCLDNGVEACLIVSEDSRLLGQVTLADIRRSILDGTALEDTSLDRHISDIAPSSASSSSLIRSDPDTDTGGSYLRPFSITADA